MRLLNRATLVAAACCLLAGPLLASPPQPVQNLPATAPSSNPQIQLPAQQATITLSPQQVDVNIPPPQVNVQQAAPRVNVQQEQASNNQLPPVQVQPLPPLQVQQRSSHPAPVIYPEPPQQFFTKPAVQYVVASPPRTVKYYVQPPAPVVLRSSSFECLASWPAPVVAQQPAAIINVNNQPQKRGLLGGLLGGYRNNKNNAPQTQVIVR